MNSPWKKLHHRRPQTVGGFKKCFEEQGQTHDKALRTVNSTLFQEKCKMKPPATKGNKKRDKLRDKLGNKMGDKFGDKLRDKQGDKLGDKGNKETMGRQGGTSWVGKTRCKVPGGKYVNSISKSRKTKSRKVERFRFEFRKSKSRKVRRGLFLISKSRKTKSRKVEKSKRKKGYILISKSRKVER